MSSEAKIEISESESSHSSLAKVEQQIELDVDKEYSFLGMSGPKLNYAIATFAGVGFLLFGYDQGVYGSLLSLPSFENQFPQIKASVNSTLQGAVIAVYELGCLTSALSTVYLGDKLGRLKCMFLGCIIVLIGAVLQATAFTVPHLAVARVITGFGTGYLTATVPVWQSELSRARSRGKLIMMQGSLITLGIAISYWIDFGFYFINRASEDSKGISWRIPVVLQVVFPILLMPVCFKLPESPRWLMSKGRVQEARVVFSAIYGLPASHEKITEQLTEIKSSLELEASAASGFKVSELFKQGPTRNFHRLSLACWSQIMQQISGINLITYYAGTIFENYIGMSAFNARILAACNGTEYFLASLFGILLIERVGRRRLLFLGAIGQALTMMVLTISGWQAKKLGDEGRDNSGAGIAAAVFLFVFNSIFGMTYLGGTWLYPPEISSLQLRAATAGLSTASNWAFNFLVVMVTPVMFANIDYYTYCVFACINALMAVVVYFFYVETSGRTLEEMDYIFNKCPVYRPWEVVKIEKNTPKRDHKTDEKDFEKPEVEHLDEVNSMLE
ncbi:hypothetical protein PVL30_005077 [Lodderomyces elongisporus]|uniref:Major facilitator superfamily (MFS) profile domain-containing protein n=1 Tax=Lodderomyces elongisporus (strain ATCC 11503 / CBS 2605 / JCM 1781 / NBRC 1676 / NRRL YB-4239) TaxID=379508 RepID=A5E7F9_LODEL|nr:uncharacterized protein PVL30_005077 [Lodderomyces elongisporus]EDK47367.1 conserved hypothetical protein [Lodderomyces elongisporus NRRL YB-4239]WLF81280.1 hypothetical protein PVL30_005077 [Lodderomyces elongisporus]